ncbi:MAG TPA: Crp/Fnr family transcriptional regulator [Gemmatimonadaceae bacterium]|nr:Crp/Fnr family transcriptional regulator [Gemmatimonadaceae bacterium]
MTEAVVARAGSRLSAEERAAIAAYAARATWPAGFVIYQRGTPADGIFVVLRGRVVLRSRVRAGRGFVPCISSAGETFGGEGLATGARYATDARADEETETLHLSGARFRAFVREQPQHALCLMSQVMCERSGLLERLRELTTLSVEQRLLSTLLRLSQSEGLAEIDGRIVLDSARYRLLCEMVGATRESVSLVLAKLVGEGLATRDGAVVTVEAPSKLASKLDQSWIDVEAFQQHTLERERRALT